MSLHIYHTVLCEKLILCLHLGSFTGMVSIPRACILWLSIEWTYKPRCLHFATHAELVFVSPSWHHFPPSVTFLSKHPYLATHKHAIISECNTLFLCLKFSLRRHCINAFPAFSRLYSSKSLVDLHKGDVTLDEHTCSASLHPPADDESSGNVPHEISEVQ